MINSRKTTLSVNAEPTLAYWRMSSDDQEASIPQQEKWGRDIAARDNLNLIGVDFDPGISGSEIEFRPGLQRLIALAADLFRKGKPARRLLVWKANRLSRADTCDTHAHVIHPLREAGITHVQTQDGKLIDLFNRNDLLLFNIEQDAMNSAALSTLASDVMRGKADIAQQGYWNGGPIPLGYGKVQTGNPQFRRKLAKLVPGTADEVSLVRWMFQEYHEKETSCTLIARDLNRRGIRPRRAASWSPNCIAVILSNRTYLGEVKWNASHHGKFCRLVGLHVQAGTRQARDEVRRRKGLRRLPAERNAAEDTIVVQGAHPALVDADLFQAVQAKLAAQAGRTSIREDRFYELADLVQCGHCEAKCWCIPNPRGGRQTITRIQCSRHRKDGSEACPESGTEHHSEVLRRVLAVLHRDLGDVKAQTDIRSKLRRRVKQSAEESASRREEVAKVVAALRTRKEREARRLLQLPETVLASATAAHEETLKELAQAQDRLDAFDTETSINPADMELAERALTMLANLPDVAPRIEALQAMIDNGDKTVDASELLSIRRQLRDVLFALLKCVRVYWKPVSAAERAGMGSGHRHHAIHDVQLTLHPHIQAALLDVTPNGTASSRNSPGDIMGEPIVLSFLIPLAS